MKRVSFIILIMIILQSFFVSCSKEVSNIDQDPLSTKFVIETDFEYHKEIGDYYQCDVVMPKVADGVLNGSLINDEIAKTFPGGLAEWENLQEGPIMSEMSLSEQFSRKYSISNIDGICSLNIIEDTISLSAWDEKEYSRKFAWPYYYDENTGEVLTKEEYLAKLSYSEEDIMEAFHSEYGDTYRNYTYGFNDLIFYFDETNTLQFVNTNIEMLVPDNAEYLFSLYQTLNGITGQRHYGLDSQEDFPEKQMLKSEIPENYDTFSGTHWLIESYDGVEVLFLVNEESEKKYVYRIETTRVNNKEEGKLEIYTYRGAQVGDTKETVLRLYPEIDAKRQAVDYMTEDYLYYGPPDFGPTLEFYFEDDIVIKLVLVNIFN